MSGSEPTPEQVERVARAIWMSAWEQAQVRLPVAARVVKKLHGDHWEDATDYTQDAHRRYARAAIAAWQQEHEA